MDMICPVCKYKHIPGGYIRKPIYYKKGPKKGQVKEWDTDEWSPGNSDFILLVTIGAKDIYACPQCRALRSN